MRVQFRVILPTLGLLLFSMQTYSSYRGWQAEKLGHYFWWSSIPLDADPLNRHPRPTTGLNNSSSTWDLRGAWVDPGLVARLLMYSGLPAFIFSAAIVRALSRFGVSQILSFMISVPVFLALWYFFVGWFVDRWLRKKSRATK